MGQSPSYTPYHYQGDALDPTFNTFQGFFHWAGSTPVSGTSCIHFKLSNSSQLTSMIVSKIQASGRMLHVAENTESFCGDIVTFNETFK